MATKKRGAKAPRPRSGFVTEEQRGTKRLTLRLKPEAMQLLYSLATEVGEGDPEKNLARTVEEALHALSREMDAEVAATQHKSNSEGEKR